MESFPAPFQLIRRLVPLPLLLALAAVPGPAEPQYVGPPQEVEAPPPPPPDEVEEPPAQAPPHGALPPPQAAVPEWSVRRLRIWGTLGATFASGQGAVGIGAGVGYFVYGGLLPTLDLSVAFGSSPTVFLVKPGLDWFLPVPGSVVPYVGGYYAHWFVSSGLPAQDAWGVRGGFSFASVGPVTFLLGIAYERVFTNCSGTCGYLVPQVAAGFAL